MVRACIINRDQKETHKQPGWVRGTLHIQEMDDIHYICLGVRYNHCSLDENLPEECASGFSGSVFSDMIVELEKSELALWQSILSHCLQHWHPLSECWFESWLLLFFISSFLLMHLRRWHKTAQDVDACHSHGRR